MSESVYKHYKYKVILKEYEPSVYFDKEDALYKKNVTSVENKIKWIRNNILTPNILYVKRDYNNEPHVAKIIAAFKSKVDYDRFIESFNISPPQ